MATQSAVFTFALPEDENSDQLLIYSSSTKGGTYSLATTVTYSYGETSYEYDSLDDTLWYKVQFNNSVDSESGPVSDAVFGGNFSNAAPFLALSTGTDGAQFATVDDVYEYAGLNAAQVARDKISKGLKRARAIIDLRTIEFDIDRFKRSWESHIARKKFNAQLRIIREAEINFALGHTYRGLSDDLVISSVTGTSTNKPAITLGGTSLGEDGGLSDTQHMSLLAALGDRYLAVGAAMLASLQPGSIRLHSSEYGSISPRFRYPFNGF